jgi:antitoxin YefM
MISISVTRAQWMLDQLIDSQEPIQIIGSRSNAVLVPEQDWRNIQETLFLASIPGLHDSIHKGLAQPIWKMSSRLGW